MIVHQLFLLPSMETSNFIIQQMSPPPFDIDYDKFAVSLYCSLQPIKVQPGRIYRAQSRKLERVYNSQLERTDWLMTLESEDMVKRWEEDQDVSPDAFYKYCFPHMPLVEGLPQATQSVRQFRVAMENSFNDNKVDLVFGNELVVTTELSFPPDYDYHQLKMMELSHGYDRIDL